MLTTDIERLWEALGVGVTGLTKPGYLLRRVSATCNADLFVALKYPEGYRALVLRAPVETLPDRKELPETRGLVVFSERLRDDEEGYGSVIVQLRETAFVETFLAFVSVLATRICTCDTPARAVVELVSQLVRWQRFLEMHSEGLGDEAQRGLYGELRVLRSLLAATGDPRLVAGWTGPSGAPQDFRFEGGMAVEVKTSISPEPQSIRINGERQLDDAGLSRLYLVSMSIDRLPAGGEKLPDLVRSVRGMLQDHPLQLDGFDALLLEAGYVGLHEQRYNADGFTVRNERTFKVQSGFPRLVEADMPEGVGQISYRVSLSACAGFAVPLAEVVDAIRAGTRKGN